MRQKKHPKGRHYIDLAGNMVIDVSNYQNAHNFSEGLAAIQIKNSQYGFINKLGEVGIEPQFQEAKDFSDGLAVVQIKGKWGAVDKSGDLVVEAKYDLLCSYSEGIAVAKYNNNLYLIDKSGQSVLNFDVNVKLNIYEDTKFSDGLIGAYDTRNSKWGFLGCNGKFVIEPKFNGVAPFSEGLAKISVIKNGQEKLGFIDTNGNIVISPEFNIDADFQSDSTDFSEGLASLTENLNPSITEEERFCYIDKTGKIVLFTDYFYAGSFHDGLAPVYEDENDKWGFINKTGKLVIPLKFDSADSFSDGLALVNIFESIYE